MHDAVLAALRSKFAETPSQGESDNIILPVSWGDWATLIVSSVEYCGHGASARGLHKTCSSLKIDAIRDASGMHDAQRHIDQIRPASRSLSEPQLPSADLSTSSSPEAPATIESRFELGAESAAVTNSHSNQKL